MKSSQKAQYPVQGLAFSMFGQPSIHLGNRELRLETRKTLALLAYLLLEEGLHARGKLAALLWPEAEENAGRASLRAALSDLKKNLGDLAGLLITQKEALGFRWDEEVWLDVRQLEAAFKHAGHHNQEATLEATLQAAAKLYRGGFLEGFNLPDAPEFDDWVVAQRELARQWLDTVLERLGELQLQSGRVHLALETAQRRVRLEPLNEAAHQQLIGLQLKLGNPGAAQEAYLVCKRVLETELGLAPSPGTNALLVQLSDTAAIESTPKVQPPQPSTNQLPEQTRLVGREEAWKLMEAAWDKGQAIFISGEAGVGKTRLIQEFLASKTGVMLYRSARPGETSVPYASLAENLRQLLTTLPNLHIEPWVRSELARILPELGQASGSMTGETDKLRFFDAIAAVMTAGFGGLAATVLDDLQFFDEASLEVTVYLNSKLAESGLAGKPNRLINLFLISLFRPSEVSPVLMEGVRSLLERDAAVLIELEPLGAVAINQMLGDLVPDNANLHELAPTMHRFTGGNPMFVLETVRTLATRGGLENLTVERFEARRRVAGLSRSPKVTAVIGRRLGRLSSLARDLARVAAILGEQFTLERAARVLDTNLLALAPACEELEHTQVWRGQKFSHDLLYEATLDGIPDSLKPILHGRVLDALEGSKTPPSVLASHAIAAGREEASFRYSYQAGVEAFKLFALPEAVEHLERIRTMGNAASELWRLLTDDQRYTLYEHLLISFDSAGLHEPQRKQPIEAEMVEFGRATSNVDVRQKTEIQAAQEFFKRTWNPLPLEQALQQRLERVQQMQDTSQEYDIVYRLGMVKYLTNRYGQALGFFTQALELAHRLGDQDLIGHCLLMIANQNFNLGEWGGVEALMDEAAKHFTAKDRPTLALWWHHRGWHLQHFGQSEEALPILQMALRAWQDMHRHSHVLVARSRVITALLDIGEYGQAYATLLEQVGEMRSHTGTDSIRAPGALLYLKLGLLGRAREFLEQDSKHDLRDRDLAAPHRKCSKASLAVALDVLEGNWVEACAWAVQAFLARQALGTQRYAYTSFLPWWLEVEALLRGGQIDLARESLHRLDQASQPYERLRIAYLRSLSVLQAWEGRGDDVIATLEEAKALALKMNLPGETWEIEAKLAELYRTSGEHNKAHQARNAAIEGIHWLADRIEDVEVRQGFIEFAHKHVIKEVPMSKT